MRTRKELRTARRRARLTQQEIAGAVGVSRPLVALIESGRRGLSPERSERIAAAINRLAAARQAADRLMADAIRYARRASR